MSVHKRCAKFASLIQLPITVYTCTKKSIKICMSHSVRFARTTMELTQCAEVLEGTAMFLLKFYK